MEAYMDDLLVKNRTADAIISNLREVFGVLYDSRMMLNPKKCIFGVKLGKFLRYMVSRWEIESNPYKIKVIEDMAPPKPVKDVQKLTGRLAALNRILSRSTQRSLRFFKALKKAYKFEWVDYYQEAFN